MSAWQPRDFPATRFICDAYSKRYTRQQMRERWQAGEYPKLNPDWARFVMETLDG